MRAKSEFPVPNVVSALTARTQLGAIMRRARDHRERFIVDRRGEPQVVILSVEDYFQNVVKQPESLTRLQEEARRRGLDKLSMEEINREVRRIRGAIRKTKHRDAS